MSKAKFPAPVVTDSVEQWTIVRVAAFLHLPYQTARNNMLSGDYGPSEYDADTRTLTVGADRVRAAQVKRTSKKRR